MGKNDCLSHLIDEMQPKCEERPPKSLKSENVQFYIMFNFWWLAKWSKQQKSTEMQKKAP